METIEERARKFALEKHPYSPFCEEYEKMYIEIATEQEAIDIAKACKAFCDTCDGCNCVEPDKCEEIKRFRKLLEE
ncbi:MAG: hypothetical protein KBT27_09075 [Prevotellaceae bacterium]|nr:hypothetical protein [Candidatus Faecinaster equi]